MLVRQVCLLANVILELSNLSGPTKFNDEMAVKPGNWDEEIHKEGDHKKERLSKS